MSRRGVPAAAPGIGANRRSPAKACAVLLPVWGAAFVQQFLDFCLPTLLAPGNVPALAQELPTRFVLLTRSCDVPLILAHPAWQQLAQHCDTDVQQIDDLIVDGNHHAAVTLAYVRALRATGTALCDIAFLFLVGDYLLADGSLRSVLDRIRGGASGVLTGNLQIRADAALPLLRERGSASRELVLPARELADWTLAHLHPCSASSIVDAGSLHDPDTNRLFWSVDRHTLIGRFYLLHMIAIRPEVGDFVVGAPCDYAFIPELCPSGNVHVITDSDEYLAVELQRQATDRRGSGRVPATRLARSLSQWTTAGHRKNAETTVVFHARDIPENINEVCALAGRFVEDIDKALSPEPQPHRGHPSWIGMMALQRAGGGLPDDCRHAVDSAISPATINGRVTSLLWRLRLWVLGHPPNVTACDPRWPDFHSLYSALKRRLKGGDRLLVLSAAAPTFARWVKLLCREITAAEWELLPSPSDRPRTAARLFDACLWIPQHEQLDKAGVILDGIARTLRPGGTLLIFAGNHLGSEVLDLKGACARLDMDARASALCIDEAHCIPAGRLRLALRRALAETMHAHRGQPRVLFPALLAASALIAAGVFVGNRVMWGARSGMPSRGNCSSILVTAHWAADSNGAADRQNRNTDETSKPMHPADASRTSTDLPGAGLMSEAATAVIENGVRRSARPRV
jgi:hypothetical protein